jgi:hypothetical protein
VRNAGSTFLHYSTEIEEKFGVMVAVLAMRQGYDLRFILLLIAAGLTLDQIFSDGSTHPLAPVAVEIAAALNVPISPQVVPLRLGTGSTYKPDVVVNINPDTEKAVTLFLRSIGASAALIAQIVRQGRLIGDTKCHCAWVAQDTQNERMLEVALRLREQDLTLIVLAMSETAMVPCILAPADAEHTWTVLGRSVFAASDQSAADACAQANKKLSYDAQVEALHALHLKNGKDFFSIHPLDGQPFLPAEVVPASSSMVGGVQLPWQLPPDSVVRRGDEPIRPPEIAVLIHPLLSYLTKRERAALINGQPEAYEAAAQLHAAKTVPRAAAAVAQAAEALKPRPGLFGPGSPVCIIRSARQLLSTGRSQQCRTACAALVPELLLICCIGRWSSDVWPCRSSRSRQRPA